MYDLFAFTVLAFLALAAASIAAGRPGSWIPARVFVAAVALRAFGSTARYEVLSRFYDGLGDAVSYFYDGLDIASQLLEHPSLLFSPRFWAGSASWWGTPFLEKVTGVLLTVIGPSMRAGFLAFSLLAFLGLWAIVRAFRNTTPDHRAVFFASWIFLWPSLWFWPSSIGKEAVLMLGIGVTVLGYAGPRPGVRWPIYLAGLGLTFCVRPHVALVVALATLVAHWLGSWERFSIRRVLEASLAAAVAVFAFSGMRAQFGLEDAGFEGMREFVEFRANQTLQGGSSVGDVPLGSGGVPMAFVNVWMRPFPWEAHNLTAAFAALEMMLFWYLVWQRRQGVGFALRHWRRHRLLRFALPFLFLYTLMIGIAFGNLGLIARQRTPIFPFLLMLLAAAPDAVTAARRRVAASTSAPDAGEPSPAPTPAPRLAPAPAANAPRIRLQGLP
jgi:hypothetical protein